MGVERHRLHENLFAKYLPLFKITTVLRKAIITVLFCCIGTIGFSQTMAGNWKGFFWDGAMKYPITLEFILNADSSFTAHSYSKGVDNQGKEIWVICDVYYKFIGKDSLYLEERHRVSPDEKVQPSCLQKMYLKIKERKKELVLNGEWQNASSNEQCAPGGSIYFIKKKTA